MFSTVPLNDLYFQLVTSSITLGRHDDFPFSTLQFDVCELRGTFPKHFGPGSWLKILLCKLERFMSIPRVF
jgi:hypothetical protein